MKFASFVTLLNVLVSSGYCLAGIVAPTAMLPAGSVVTQAATIFALYAAARTLPLALLVVVDVYRRSAAALLVLGPLAGIIQLVDAGVGFYQHDVQKSLGPLLLGLLQLYAIFRLRNSLKNSPVQTPI